MRLAAIKYNDIVDCEEGICVSLWMQGCSLHCPKCQNPQTWDFNGGFEMPIDEVISTILLKINENGIHRDFSVLGGEPLAPLNIEWTLEILKAVRSTYPNIKIYLWTGYDFTKTLMPKQIADLVDVIIDGPYIDKERDITLPLRGSRNQRILRKGEDF